MTTAPRPAPHATPPQPLPGATALAARITLILRGLAALIARAFLKHPFRAALILPLYRRLTRAAQRFERAMARLAAGKPPRKPRPSTRSGPPPPTFPTRRGWLLHDLRHEAALFTMQLETLLAEPEAAALIAACPQAARILRPICKMLAVSKTALPALPKPKPRRRPAAPIPVAHPLRPTRRPRLLFPRRISKTA